MAKDKAKLSDFQTQRRNTNKHKPRGMGMLDNVIAKEGWIGAITTAANNEAFAGSARLETAQGRFGDEFEPIVFDIDGTRPVVLRRVDIPTADDPRAIRLGIGDNRIQEVNNDTDAELLALLVDEGNDISDMYFEDELAALVERDQIDSEGTNDVDEIWQGMPEFEQNDADAFKSIKVNFYSLDDLNNFADLVGQKITEKTKYINYPVVLKEDLKAYSVKNES